jgi:FlaA1/EpsC-like NDP-sugar epimerase
LSSQPNCWKNKSVLITGVCGTVGRELLRQVIESEAAEVMGLDNNESELFFLEVEFESHPNVQFSLGDLRDPAKLVRKMRKVDIVLHAAAFKHVMLCEKAPRDAIQTNIIGVQNVIDAALANGVERMLFTSSDKAVNPTNVMGTSKLMGERLMTATNAVQRGKAPIFVSTRFGNVLGSRGSVIPLFKRQIAMGGPITLTDPAMTRFIMTLKDAVRLVMNSVFMAEGGEVFVTKMPVVRIEDLAQIMRQELAPRFGFRPEDVPIEVVGLKPGEKLYEELLNEEETRRSVELDDYFVVLPAFKSLYREVDYSYLGSKPVGIEKPYNSAVETPLSYEELRGYLLEHQLLDIEVQQ